MLIKKGNLSPRLCTQLDMMINRNDLRFVTRLLLIILTCVLTIFVFPKVPLNAQQTAVVANIVDGDTIDVKMSGCRVPWKDNPSLCRIRLACIKTPEYGQSPFFENAKSALQSLTPVGSTLTIRDTGQTSYDRVVAEIFANNNSINLQMVLQGKAAVYCKHIQDCAGSQQSYMSAENTAKQAGLGIWNPQQSWPLPEVRPCAVLNR